MARKARILAQAKKTEEDTEVKPLSKRAKTSKNQQRKINYKKLNRRQKAAVERLEKQEARRIERDEAAKKAALTEVPQKTKSPKKTHSPKPTPDEVKFSRSAPQTKNEEKEYLATLPNMRTDPEAVRKRARASRPSPGPKPQFLCT